MIYVYVLAVVWAFVAMAFSVFFDMCIQNDRPCSGRAPWKRAVFCMVVSVIWPIIVLFAIKKAREAKE